MSQATNDPKVVLSTIIAEGSTARVYIGSTTAIDSSNPRSPSDGGAQPFYLKSDQHLNDVLFLTSAEEALQVLAKKRA